LVQFRENIKIVAIRCHIILKLKCTKFNFGWGSASDLAGGAYSVPQVPWLDLRGPLLTERRGGKGRGGRRWKGPKGRGRKGVRGGTQDAESYDDCYPGIGIPAAFSIPK